MHKFAPVIAKLDPGSRDFNALVLHRDGPLSIFYAPFDWVNPAARIVVVGITPGLQQMELALAAAREALLVGGTVDQASQSAKRTASFAGDMRRNLVTMLDGLELPAALGVTSTAALFADRADLLHPTSAVRYPVFVGAENYTGHSPPLLRSRVLLRYVEETLAAELTAVPDALIVPRGDAVSGALRHLADRDKVDEGRCLLGFPHPSGANGWRKRHFAQRREQMARVVDRWAGRMPPWPAACSTS